MPTKKIVTTPKKSSKNANQNEETQDRQDQDVVKENKKIIDNGPLTVHYIYDENEDSYDLFCMDYKEILIPLYEKHQIKMTFDDSKRCMVGKIKVLPRDFGGIVFIEFGNQKFSEQARKTLDAQVSRLFKLDAQITSTRNALVEGKNTLRSLIMRHGMMTSVGKSCHRKVYSDGWRADIQETTSYQADYVPTTGSEVKELIEEFPKHKKSLVDAFSQIITECELSASINSKNKKALQTLITLLNSKNNFDIEINIKADIENQKELKEARKKITNSHFETIVDEDRYEEIEDQIPYEVRLHKIMSLRSAREVSSRCNFKTYTASTAQCSYCGGRFKANTMECRDCNVVSDNVVSLEKPKAKKKTVKKKA